VTTEPSSCSYPIVARYQGQPHFITVGDSKDLIIATDDRSTANVYTLELTVSMEIPDDYTRTSFKAIRSTERFTVSVVDPCLTTQLDVFSIADVSLSRLGGSQIRELPLHV